MPFQFNFPEVSVACPEVEGGFPGWLPGWLAGWRADRRVLLKVLVLVLEVATWHGVLAVTPRAVWSVEVSGWNVCQACL